jgi:methanogenic corrinoid protein MtbC1
VEILKKIADALYDGDEYAMPGLVQEAVDAGCEAQEVLDAMMAGMAIVGEEFSRDELYIPEVLCSCHAMMIGGAPITQDFCDRMGCDGFAKDAGGAAALAVELCQK